MLDNEVDVIAEVLAVALKRLPLVETVHGRVIALIQSHIGELGILIELEYERVVEQRGVQTSFRESFPCAIQAVLIQQFVVIEASGTLSERMVHPRTGSSPASGRAEHTPLTAIKPAIKIFAVPGIRGRRFIKSDRSIVRPIKAK